MGSLLIDKLASHKSKTILSQTTTYIILVLMAVVMLTPFLWTLSTSLKTFEDTYKNASSLIPSSLNFSNYAVIFKKMPFATYFLNTFKVSFLVCFGTLITSAMAAYAFSRLKFPGRDALFFLYLSTLMIPRQVVLVPNFLLFKAFGLLDNHFSLVFTGIFTAYGTFLLRQFFFGIPKELEEAAVVDGYGYFSRFTKIILPLAKPALTTLFIITLLNIWNEYLYALVFINSDCKRTLTLGLALMRGDLDVQWNLVMAATIISISPIIIIYLNAQKFFIEGIALSGVKG